MDDSHRPLTPFELKIYRRTGLTDAEAQTWADSGIAPYLAETFRDAGLDFPQALEWPSAGIGQQGLSFESGASTTARADEVSTGVRSPYRRHAPTKRDPSPFGGRAAVPGHGSPCAFGGPLRPQRIYVEGAMSEEGSRKRRRDEVCICTTCWNLRRFGDHVDNCSCIPWDHSTTTPAETMGPPALGVDRPDGFGEGGVGQ